MKRFASAAVAVLVASCAPALADTWYVNMYAPADFTTIGEAVAAASSGDTVLVGSGEYTGDNNYDIDLGAKSLVIISEEYTYNTIITPGGMGRAFILRDAGTDTSTVIRGFTIRQGWATGPPLGVGGGILCEDASPKIEQCTFEACDAERGGGIGLIRSDARVRFCRFGTSFGDGAGLATEDGDPLIESCSFWANMSYEGSGAVRCDDGSLTMRNCTVAWNDSWGRAGTSIGLYGSSVSATIVRSIIAFDQSGSAIEGGTAGTIEQNIVYGNVGGDVLPAYAGDNMFEDPYFCNMGSGNLMVCSDSWALPHMNDWHVQVGHYGPGCPPCNTPVESATWGGVKALFR